MSIAALNYISDIMKSIGIPYQFGEWTDEVPDRYYVGEYQEIPSPTKEEDGGQETSFILNGWTRKSCMILEQDKETIERSLPKSRMNQDGSCVAVFYDSAFPVPTGDGELKRIQINLTIKEWKVI